jgi:hypothetical protein
MELVHAALQVPGQFNDTNALTMIDAAALDVITSKWSTVYSGPAD